MARATKKERRTQPQMDWMKIDKLIWNLVNTWDGSTEKKSNILEGVKDQFLWTHSQAEVACQLHFNYWLRKNGLPEIPYDNILKVEEEMKQLALAKAQADLPVKSTTRKKRTVKKPPVESKAPEKASPKPKTTTKSKTTKSKSKAKTAPKKAPAKSKTTTKRTTKKTTATLDNFV